MKFKPDSVFAGWTRSDEEHEMTSKYSKLNPLILSLVLSTCLLATNAYAASFDCSKASSNTEAMICADAQLSDLDSKLSAAYINALKGSSNGATLKDEQRKWLRYIRAKCSDADCLKKAYRERIAVLPLGEIVELTKSLDSSSAAQRDATPPERYRLYRAEPYSSGSLDYPRMCRSLLKILQHKDTQRPAGQPHCARRLSRLPPGFPDFELPDWRPIPQEDISYDLVKETWKAWLIPWAKLRNKPFDELWQQEGFEADIQRRLSDRSLGIQRAEFGLDQNGDDDLVQRIDVTRCDDDLSKTISNYPYPKIVGLHNAPPHAADERLRLGSATYGGDIFLYMHKPYVYEFQIGVPNTGARAIPNNHVGLIWIRSIRTGAIYMESMLGTSAPLCEFSIDR